jgi:hypothetical protein
MNTMSKASASSGEMLQQALRGETTRKIAADIGVSGHTVLRRIRAAAAAANLTDELESALRSRRRGPEGLPPPRELLAVVARLGSVSDAASELGFSASAVKNRLSAFYKSHGYSSARHAVWHEFVMPEHEPLAAPVPRIRDGARQGGPASTMSKAPASSHEMLQRALGGQTLRKIAAEVGISHQAVWHRIHSAAAAAERTDELKSAFRSRRHGPERLPPPRELLAIVARSGSRSAAAAELGFSAAAISHNLGAFYRARGYSSAKHAVWHEFVSPERDTVAPPLPPASPRPG